MRVPLRVALVVPCALASTQALWRLMLLGPGFTAGLLLGIILCGLAGAWSGEEAPPRVWGNRRVRELLARVPAAFRGPQPCWWLRNAHVQLLVWWLSTRLQNLCLVKLPFERYEVELPTALRQPGNGYAAMTPQSDGDSPGATADNDNDDDAFGDCDDEGAGSSPENAEAFLAEICTVDVCPGREALPPSTPCVVFLPGLRGDSSDLPGASQVRACVRQGWRCVVMHRRGHTRGRKLQAPRFDVFGDPREVAVMLDYLLQPGGPVSPEAPLFLVGQSEGSTLLVNTLKHLGDRSPFLCALGICPGYEISLEPNSCLARISWPYESMLLSAAKSFFCKLNAAVLRTHSQKGYEECIAAQSFTEFVMAHAGFAGYESIDKYMEERNPVRSLSAHTEEDWPTPLVLLSSGDDPIYVEQNVLDHGQVFEQAQAPVGIVLTSTGSHGPFLDGPRLQSWSDSLLIELFEAALAEEPRERYPYHSEYDCGDPVAD